MAWRKAERQRLISLRLTLSSMERRTAAACIAASLDRLIGPLAGRILSFYWPLRGEPDLRPWFSDFTGENGWASLPVVVSRNAPLVFRTWCRGEKLMPGVWNIPCPQQGRVVVPDIVIVPVVGFDDACFRLGYGGGYFDRTLAAINPRPVVIGVGYELAYLPTIHPLSHDVPMGAIVTEQRVLRPHNDVAQLRDGEHLPEVEMGA